LAVRIVELYRQHCADDVGTELLAFYRAFHACVRAKLAAWHLHEDLKPATAQHWRQRAEWYLGAAGTLPARL
jgi:aminoglycoside phosphotransferase family enzyme